MKALLTACLFFPILMLALNCISNSAHENCSTTLTEIFLKQNEQTNDNFLVVELLWGAKLGWILIETCELLSLW